MLKSNQQLLHPVDFDNAMYFGIPIRVFQHGEVIEYGGAIVKNTDQAVKIGEAYFLKWKCEFKVT